MLPFNYYDIVRIFSPEMYVNLKNISYNKTIEVK